MLTFC
jgi:hypothetical protein